MSNPPAIDFETLLAKLQRALRRSDDLDAASALIALLFHRLYVLEGEERRIAIEGIAAMIKMIPLRGGGIVLTEGQGKPRRLRITH